MKQRLSCQFSVLHALSFLELSGGHPKSRYQNIYKWRLQVLIFNKVPCDVPLCILKQRTNLKILNEITIRGRERETLEKGYIRKDKEVGREGRKEL